MRWRAVTRADRQMAALWCMATVGILMLLPLWEALLPVVPACPAKSLTGIPCPSCGTTRAAGAFLRGEILGALAWNPLAAAGAVGFVLGGLVAPLWVRTRAPLPVLGPSLSRPARWAVLGAVATNWLYLVLRGV